jgi:hypothetical protein
VASAQTAALFVRSAVQAHHDQDGGAPEAIVSTHFLMTAMPSSYSPSAMLNMALVSSWKSLVGGMRTVSVTQVAGRDAKGRILPQLVQASRPENVSVSAPRADSELSNVDWSDARVSFRWIFLAGAVLHVIPDGTPMVVSRLAA